MKEVYGKDLVVYDTKPIRKLEPQFLKEIDNPLEPEPMFLENKSSTNCGGYSKSVTLYVDKFSDQALRNKIDKSIDSIRFNDLEKRVNIKVVLNKQTSYQTFIDILDVFETKQSIIYGVAKDTLFWIE